MAFIYGIGIIPIVYFSYVISNNKNNIPAININLFIYF